MKGAFSIILISVSTICLIFQNNLWLGNVFQLIKIPVLIITGIYCFRKRKNFKTFRVKTSFVLLVLYGLSICHYSIRSYNTKHTEGNISLKIMSYNLFFKNQYPNQAIELIRSENPSIVCLQEVTPTWQNLLNKKLTQFPFKLELPRKGTHGLCIFSKYPISSKKILSNKAGLPVAQIAEAKIKNKTILVYNTHLASPAAAVENPENFINLWSANYKDRKSQLEEINSLAEENDAHYDCQLLAGDLNTMWFEPIFKDLQTEWENSESNFSELSSFTFPNTNKLFPFIKLDYIMSKGEINCNKFKVIKGGSSDHLAVAGEFSI